MRSSFKILSTVFIIVATTLSSCKQQTTEYENKEKVTHQPTMDSVSISGNYADVNGINMYYEIHGQGEPLVLIHGGGSTIVTNFKRLIPLLSKTYKVIAVEMQAHGRTSDREAPESFEQDADDIAALLKYLNIPKANILGFSNGGSTSLQVAIRHPESVMKVVAISAISKRNGMFDGFFDFMQKGTFKEMPQIYKDAFLSVTPDETKLLNMFSKDRQRMLDFKDWSDSSLKSISSPVLLMVGDKDVVRPEHCMEMARIIPNARLAVVPGNHGNFIGEEMSTPPDYGKIKTSVSIIVDFLETK